MGRGDVGSTPHVQARTGPAKPMASAARVSLFSRQIEIGLSSAAIDILFDKAVVLSEGGVQGNAYYGSTMVTFDLARAAALVSDSCDAATVKRVSELIAHDDRIKERARALGAEEARRCAAVPLAPPQVDLRVNASGSHLHLDLDVEAQVLASGSSRRDARRK